MWHWDQGRMAYFQYDALRKVARFLTRHPWSGKDDDNPVSIEDFTGFEFAAPILMKFLNRLSRLTRARQEKA